MIKHAFIPSDSSYVFPEVLNSIRKNLAPYMFIPVYYELSIENTIDKFLELNPRCRITKIKNKYTVYIDNLQYDTDTNIFTLIPINKDNSFHKKWALTKQDQRT